ncbi:DUF1566 domain-containing protein [Desulfobotulus mexicanus]|uniref:DUF1566 domain-containing protein n=1 Tax=Desulfobotulus mexicanus TaxID=2586642 RepID=A0A5S5ME20_9BACT|nr:DUF1566 domain-containing protein [Desulfobotulus mexicanus]TYT73875.1 DUF1566 domain-containing protein [Desulfobotulus mexicanus]
MPDSSPPIHHGWQPAAILLFLIFLIFPASRSVAGPLEPPQSPEETVSYTLQDLYDRLNTGADNPPTQGFTEPASGPSSDNFKDINTIMNKAPATDTNNGAAAGNVLQGKTFWGLLPGEWGTQTGTMPDRGTPAWTPGTEDQPLGPGYYSGGTITGDPNLKPENIRAGVVIFGITGTYSGITWSNTGPDANGRWHDNGDGTVTDLQGADGTGQGLVWLKNASWGGQHTWENAHPRAEALFSGIGGMIDGSKARDWRLPSAEELNAISQGNDPVSGTTPGPFTGIQSSSYWSSDAVSNLTGMEWDVYLEFGGTIRGHTEFSHSVWPVRNSR